MNSETTIETKLARYSRWLAIVAGLLVAITGSLGWGPLFAFYPSIMIIGAVAQPRSGYSGTWLMWLGTFWVSIFTFLYFPRVALQSLKLMIDGHGHLDLLMLILSALSTVAVALCDVALVVDAWKSKGNVKNASSNKKSGQWVVGVVAASLTAWAVPAGVRAILNYPRIGRIDLILTPLAFVVPVILLDVRLITKMLKAKSQTHHEI
jgi:hypothetical protein